MRYESQSAISQNINDGKQTDTYFRKGKLLMKTLQDFILLHLNQKDTQKFHDYLILKYDLNHDRSKVKHMLLVVCFHIKK